MLRFHPLEHLHPLEFHRPDKTVLHSAGSTIDLRSCSSSLEFVEVDVMPAIHCGIQFYSFPYVISIVLLSIFFRPSRSFFILLLFVFLPGTYCTLGGGGSNCTIRMDCCLHVWIFTA